MKTKTISLFASVILLSIFITNKGMSQQLKDVSQASGSVEQLKQVSARGNYTYRLFIAPNKVYGYDIFQSGKIIFHQPAQAESVGGKENALIKKQQADQAAMRAIEKIKNGFPAELTKDEIMQITVH